MALDINKLEEVKRRLMRAAVELTDSIKDKYLSENFLSKCFFAGGCIYSLYHDKEPKDYDIFCTDKDYAERLREYLITQWKPTCVTDNAITAGEFQFITKWIGEPKDVAIEFDFMHNMTYWHNGEIHILTDEKWFAGNDLKFNFDRARDIASVITRVPKFVARGMTISRKEMARIMEKILNESDLDYERDSASCIARGSSARY